MMKLEDGLIAADTLTKKGGAAIIKNTGKIVAVITLIVATLFTFTDVALSSLTSEEFTATLVIMLIASYLMYFSLEDAGEKLGYESEEYIRYNDSYSAVRGKITGKDILSLRVFCTRYADEELRFRQKRLLLDLGYSEEEYRAYLRGEEKSPARKRDFAKVKKLKASNLTPQSLLSQSNKAEECEFADKGRLKLLKMALKLIPTAVCTVVTVSVILTVKDGLTVSDVVGSIIKLSSLPIIGCRGYATGYGYVKNTVIPTLSVKQRIIEAYLTEREKDCNQE